MFVLKYKLKETGFGRRIFLLTEITEEGKDGILIRAEGAQTAAVIINNQTYRLKDGEVLLSTEDVKDGEISPKFVTGTTICTATPFIKAGSLVRWANISWEYAPDALSAFLKLEELILGLRDEILCIKQAVNGKKLLTFEEDK